MKTALNSSFCTVTPDSKSTLTELHAHVDERWPMEVTQIRISAVSYHDHSNNHHHHRYDDTIITTITAAMTATSLSPSHSYLHSHHHITTVVNAIVISIVSISFIVVTVAVIIIFVVVVIVIIVFFLSPSSSSCPDLFLSCIVPRLLFVLCLGPLFLHLPFAPSILRVGFTHSWPLLAPQWPRGKLTTRATRNAIWERRSKTPWATGRARCWLMWTDSPTSESIYSMHTIIHHVHTGLLSEKTGSAFWCQTGLLQTFHRPSPWAQHNSVIWYWLNKRGVLSYPRLCSYYFYCYYHNHYNYQYHLPLYNYATPTTTTTIQLRHYHYNYHYRYHYTTHSQYHHHCPRLLLLLIVVIIAVVLLLQGKPSSPCARTHRRERAFLPHEHAD